MKTESEIKEKLAKARANYKRGLGMAEIERRKQWVNALEWVLGD